MLEFINALIYFFATKIVINGLKIKLFFTSTNKFLNIVLSNLLKSLLDGNLGSQFLLRIELHARSVECMFFLFSQARSLQLSRFNGNQCNFLNFVFK
jgi:hypothetical protein